MSWEPQADLSWQGKRELLAEYFDERPYRTVMETGLWNGQGSCEQFADRASVWAIESNPESVALALKRKSGYAWVIEGDSARWLPELLAKTDHPAFFWLDAHLVAEAGEENHSPLLAELEAVIAWPHAAGSVLLVDDVRMMGREGWPTLDEVLALTGPVWGQLVEADILRLTPR